MEKNCESRSGSSKEEKKGMKMDKRKRPRRHISSPQAKQSEVVVASKDGCEHNYHNRSPVATYLLARILAANSLSSLRPAPITNRDYKGYLQPAVDQFRLVSVTNRLVGLRKQMEICWNENWRPSSSRISLGTNKNKIPLAMEIGWIRPKKETRLKSTILMPAVSLTHSKSVESETKKDEKIFYIHGNNGTKIIDEYLTSKKWTRTSDAKSNFKLRWVESRSQIKYKVFREGEQMVNHIPSTWRMSNKIHMVGILKDLDAHQRPGLLKINQVIPETYRLNLIEEQFQFKQAYKDGEVWICKPATLNQGKGIFLIRKLKDYALRCGHGVRKSNLGYFQDGGNLPSRIVQRYIKNPLLLNGRKADIRCFMLIASTSPFLILTHPGYVRLSCKQYDVESEEAGIHLTNQYVQKKDARYSVMKDDTIWSMEQLNTYINHYILSQQDIDSDWVLNVMNTQIRRLMLHCFLAAKTHLETKVGFFELLGFDFLIDEKLKVWLLEVNVNPSFCTNCQVLNELIPQLIRETLDISIECFEKSKRRSPLMPLKSIKKFSLLYCAERTYLWPIRHSQA